MELYIYTLPLSLMLFVISYWYHKRAVSLVKDNKNKNYPLYENGQFLFLILGITLSLFTLIYYS